MPNSPRKKSKANARRTALRPKSSRKSPASSRRSAKARSSRASARTTRVRASGRRSAASRPSNRGVASDRALRELLARQLDGGHAFATFADAIRDLPPELRGVKPAGAAHSPWQVLEHLRIAQWDIVDFTRDPAHRSPEWPSGYWPQDEAPPDDAAWNASVREFEREREAMKRLIADPRNDLFARIDHPEAQAQHTIAREAVVLSEHNGYHTAELILLRRMLGAWPSR